MIEAVVAILAGKGYDSNEIKLPTTPATKTLNTLNFIDIMTKTAQLYAKKVNFYQ